MSEVFHFGYDKVAVVKKWAPLLEGLPDRTADDKWRLYVTAAMLENTMRAAKKNLGENIELVEGTSSSNAGGYTKFILPLLRRVFPNLILNEIASLQPMTAPIGAVFYRDWVYDTSKGATTRGAVAPRDFDKDYSGEYVNGEILVTGDGVNYGGAGTALSAVLAFNPVRPLDTTRGFSVVVSELNATTGAVVQTATDNASGGFTGNVTAGAINYSNGAISGFKFTAAVTNGNPVKAYYYYDMEANSKLPQMMLDIKQDAVKVQSRKLKTVVSVEAIEDIKAFHGEDVEKLLVDGPSQEMALEIDREGLNDMLLASTGTSTTFDRVPGAGVAELDHLRGILTQISTVSNLIHKKTLRSPATWIVTSPEVSALLEQLTTHGDLRPIWTAAGGPMTSPLMAPMQFGGQPHGQYPIYQMGTLMNKLKVYVDPFFTRDMMLLGWKGDSYLDSAYVHLPYVPATLTAPFEDPNDGTVRRQLRTRYARKLTRADAFGQLRVLNL